MNPKKFPQLKAMNDGAIDSTLKATLSVISRMYLLVRALRAEKEQRSKKAKLNS